MYNGEGAQVTSIYRLLLFESSKEAAGNLGFSCYRIVVRRGSRWALTKSHCYSPTKFSLRALGRYTCPFFSAGIPTRMPLYETLTDQFDVDGGDLTSLRLLSGLRTRHSHIATTGRYRNQSRNERDGEGATNANPPRFL